METRPCSVEQALKTKLLGNGNGSKQCIMLMQPKILFLSYHSLACCLSPGTGNYTYTTIARNKRKRRHRLGRSIDNGAVMVYDTEATGAGVRSHSASASANLHLRRRCIRIRIIVLGLLYQLCAWATISTTCLGYYIYINFISIGNLIQPAFSYLSTL